MPQKTKNVRDLLIAETLRQIEAVGPEKLSLRKIAAACGVTHATAYKYFENKQALIHLCRERVGKRLIAYMRRAARTAGEPFVAFMKAYLHYMTRHAQYHYLSICTRIRSPKAPRRLKSVRRRSIGIPLRITSHDAALRKKIFPIS